MSRFVYGLNPVLEALKAHPHDVVRVLLERGRDGRRSHAGERVAEAAASAGVRIGGRAAACIRAWAPS